MLRDWLLTAQTSLRAAREEIDALNVFPVPDGDTGTNLYLTWEAACEVLRHGEMDSPELNDSAYQVAAREIGRHAILGARGNSGVIMSALLRDICLSLSHEPQSFARALRAGAQGAYNAVAAPVEGTILTVARACADRAEELSHTGAELAEVVTEAAEAAYAALLETPDVLDQLRQAGVVDAGGRGLVVVLDSLVTSITGQHPARRQKHQANRGSSDSKRIIGLHQNSKSPGSLEFEVMYHLTAPEADGLHTALSIVGHSVMVAGMDNIWNVHVHVPSHRISDAINVGLERGTMSHLSVTLLDSVDPVKDFEVEQPMSPHLNEPTGRTRRLIGVSHGPGVQRLLSDQGAIPVQVPARQQPSAAELIDAGKQAGTSEVIILPSDRDAHSVAEIAARELKSMGIRSSVIPTRSITQTLAAMAVHDPDLDFEHDVVSMTRAASATHYGAVTIATRDVLTMAGQCQTGDILGLIDGEISLVGTDLREIAQGVLERMLAPGAELVTIVSGCESHPTDVTALITWIKTYDPLIHTQVIHGEQPLWPYIFGVE
jgi:DAK2 domain fusion protein YloV